MTDASAEEGVSTLISESGCHVSLRHSTVHSDSSGGGLWFYVSLKSRLSLPEVWSLLKVLGEDQSLNETAVLRAVRKQ